MKFKRIAFKGQTVLVASAALVEIENQSDYLRRIQTFAFAQYHIDSKGFSNALLALHSFEGTPSSKSLKVDPHAIKYMEIIKLIYDVFTKNCSSKENFESRCVKLKISMEDPNQTRLSKYLESLKSIRFPDERDSSSSERSASSSQDRSQNYLTPRGYTNVEVKEALDLDPEHIKIRCLELFVGIRVPHVYLPEGFYEQGSFNQALLSQPVFKDNIALASQVEIVGQSIEADLAKSGLTVASHNLQGHLYELIFFNKDNQVGIAAVRLLAYFSALNKFERPSHVQPSVLGSHANSDFSGSELEDASSQSRLSVGQDLGPFLKAQFAFQFYFSGQETLPKKAFSPHTLFSPISPASNRMKALIKAFSTPIDLDASSGDGSNLALCAPNSVCFPPPEGSRCVIS